MSEAVAQRRFPWTRYGWTLALIVVLALLPLLSVMAAYGIAEPNGCRVDEAGVYPCVVLGVDLGGALAVMAVLGWLMLASLPLGGGALIVWLVILIIHFLAWQNGRGKDALK